MHTESGGSVQENDERRLGDNVCGGDAMQRRENILTTTIKTCTVPNGLTYYSSEECPWQ